MSKYPRLQRRPSGYYIRAKVPANLVPFVGSKEVVRNLGTTNFTDAVGQWRIQDAMIENRFTLARLQFESSQAKEVELTSDDALRLALNWFQDELEKEAAEDYSLLVKKDEERQAVLDNIEEDIAVLSDFQEGAPIYGSTANVANKVLRNKQLLPPPLAAASTTSFLQRHKIAAKPTGPGYVLFCQYIARGMLENAKRSRDRLNKNFGEKSYDVMFEDVRYDPNVKQVTLKKLIESFENAEERKRVSPKTRTATNAAFRIAKEVIGEETSIFTLDRSDFRRVQNLVKRLPKNALQRFPKKTLKEIAVIADRGGYELMSTKTATAQLRHISALFEFAIREFGLPHNHARGLTIGTEGRKGTIRRGRFSPEQLRKIFTAPLYTGCKDDENSYSIPGVSHPRRGRFWVPLIALFTGMRLNEICQLRTIDVRQHDGVDCIFIQKDPEGDERADQLRIKTEAGERFIPIHSELKTAGFLSYVYEMQAASSKRLFPTLPMGKDTYFSSPFSKWFSRFLQSVGVKTKQHVFHSFRHNFRDAMREAELGRDVVIALGGWTAGGAEEGYGSGLKASTLARHLEKICYEGLDLSHLYTADKTDEV